jgi:hypothetical protein
MRRAALEITVLPLVSRGGVAGLLMTSLSLSEAPPNCSLEAWVFVGAFAIGSRPSAAATKRSQRRYRCAGQGYSPFRRGCSNLPCSIADERLSHTLTVAARICPCCFADERSAHTATNATFVSSRLAAASCLHRGRCQDCSFTVR